MRILGRAIAFAGIFVVLTHGAIAAELLPPDRPIAEVVDHYIGATLDKERVKPAPPADDLTLLRRLTLDLAGRIPTAAESRAYRESTDPEKAIGLVDRLMASPGFVRHQAAELDAMLMGGDRASLRDYLARAVGENRSWDRIFRELMLPDQTDKARKSAAEYLRARIKDPERLTADVSSTFFGVNISCAQCHDHPLVDDWKQDHFFGMKAFFDRTFVNGNGAAGFLGEHEFGTARFKTTEGVERPARMMFLTGRKVTEPEAGRDASGEEKKKEKERLQKALKDKAPPPSPRFSARAKLVEMALAPGDREFFARAIVNRTWHRLLGRGLVMPLDQMHSANPPSHPELLAWLARDTIEHGYDLRRLVRGLVLSRAYARDSRWDAGEPPRPSLFAVAVVRPLSPLQLACSLRLAASDPASLSGELKPAGLDRKIEALADASRSMAALLGSSGGDGQIGVAEALFFSNSKRISQEVLADGDGRLVARLLKVADPAEQSAGLKPAELDRKIEALADASRPMAASLGSSGGDGQIGVAEALFFSNSKRISQEVLADGDGRLVARLLKVADPAEQIDLAVGNVLSRPPDAEERRILAEYLEHRTDRPEDACRQLVWALLASPEFRFNH